MTNQTNYFIVKMTDAVFPILQRRQAVLFDSSDCYYDDDDGHLRLLPSMESVPKSIPLNTVTVLPESYSSKYKNIILDMDGTLLDRIPEFSPQNPNYGKKTPIARPHLLDFMEFVFEHFERVSIWTAAMPGWYDICYKQILRHYIPEGRRFDFVKTRNLHDPYIELKPLSEIYRQFADEYNAENTLIVDDNPNTYRDNPENAVEIQSFWFDNLTPTQLNNLEEADMELLRVIEEIRCRISGM